MATYKQKIQIIENSILTPLILELLREIDFELTEAVAENQCFVVDQFLKRREMRQLDLNIKGLNLKLNTLDKILTNEIKLIHQIQGFPKKETHMFTFNELKKNLNTLIKQPPKEYTLIKLQFKKTTNDTDMDVILNIIYNIMNLPCVYGKDEVIVLSKCVPQVNFEEHIFIVIVNSTDISR